MIRKAAVFKWNSRVAFWLRLCIMAIFFLIGLFAGVMVAKHTTYSVSEELLAYFAGYVQSAENRMSPAVFISILFAYFQYPLFATLLGFASIGVILLPLVSLICGFILAFSTSCMAIALGSRGILLALVVIGLRSFVTVFCFFIIAVPALGTSTLLAFLSFGSGRRTIPVVYGKSWWLRIGLCAVVLLTSACVDFWVTPKLLLWLLHSFL